MQTTVDIKDDNIFNSIVIQISVNNSAPLRYSKNIR